MGGSAFALAVLFAINLTNFFDRQIIGGVGEGIRRFAWRAAGGLRGVASSGSCRARSQDRAEGSSCAVTRAEEDILRQEVDRSGYVEEEVARLHRRVRLRK